ncbi:MAG TPA: PQQ-dependent dehydrogenase, methanol/ethanol family [Bryobacteraceae bacterium]|nr:PQQ-dependent dehydrogenase, methanol/ethanol family [Bryobacteraceae bacterium]
MTRARVLLLLSACGACAAQVSRDPQQIELGRATFRIYCSPCHGIRAQGGRGPDLTRGTYANGDQDADLFRVISRGVPGTEMVSFSSDLDEANIWRVISFIRSAARPEAAAVRGDAPAGEKLFWGKGGCGQCHVVGNRGGRLGPELTRVGRQRSLAYLRESVVSPSADLTSGYETVTVTSRNGRRIVGVQKSLDNFSVQLMDAGEQIRSFRRSEVAAVTREQRSLMPDTYGRLFSETELNDLLAYLVSLRGGPAPAPPLDTRGLDETRLRQAQDDPSAWLMYGRNYAGWRYSQLSQIHTGNVAQLRPQWTFQAPGAGRMETTPLVSGRMMWFTGSSNHAYALDLESGNLLWHYHESPPQGLHLCCGEVNRGFAALGDRLFKVNIEGDLAALDAKSGRLLWKTRVADHRQGYSATAAPLVVKNLVLVGIAGAEFGTRGFIDAYDASSGRRVWRFYTVPGAGEPGGETWGGDSWRRGGGSTWITGTYDPDLNLVYWGTGNPGPDMNGDVRPGDNLYTCSLVALDADTGKLKWHFQFTPHDVHDWDAISDPVLVDLPLRGDRVKAVIQANRNGFFYALDRTNGKLLAARSYTKVTWARGIDAGGKPILVAGQEPTEDGNRSCPGLGGGHNWQATAYSPQTGLYYFSSTDGCHLYFKMRQDYLEGQWYQASTVDSVPREPTTGSIIAVNPATGETHWRFELVTSPSAGILATAGGLVFTGDPQGHLFALDARTGKALWHYQTGAAIAAPPITYVLDGKQYLAVASGSSLFTFALP